MTSDTQDEPQAPDPGNRAPRRQHWFGRVRTRFWLGATGLVALVLMGNGLLVLRMEEREVRESLLRESLTFARLAGPQVLRAFGESFRGEAADPEVLGRVADVVRGLPAFEALALLGPRGRPLLVYPAGATLPPVPEDVLGQGTRQTFRPGPTGEVLEIVQPAQTVRGPPVWLQLTVSDAPVRSRVAALRRAYGGSLVVLLLLAALLASRAARRILGPLESLKAAALAIRDGDMTVRAPEEGGGELGEMARAFNAMTREIGASRSQLEARHAALEKAYAELQILQRELVESEKMAAVGRLAASVSHEVDNPIGVILGTAQMLRDELADRPAVAEDLRVIETECLRCRRIVRDLLDLARPASAATGPVDVEAVAASVLRGLSHHTLFRQVRGVVSWSRPLPKVHADPDHLKQVLMNLLLNAAQAMEGKGTITLEGQLREGRVRVTVRDEGPGIPSGATEKIFEPFFTTRSGAGLGLSVSRRLMEEQGGRLWAENLPELGSAFHLELPAEEREGGDARGG